MMRGLVGCAGVALFVSMAFVRPASAQIFYEPVQYQYDSGAGRYYYGGSDWRVHEFAHVWAYRIAKQRGDYPGAPVIDRSAVYSDAWPYQNVSALGWSANDARNQAYANAPRYFRKSDLLARAVPVGDAWVVPAQAQSKVDSPPPPPVTIPGAQPVAPRGMILIIPRKLLEKPARPDASLVLAK